MHVVKFLVISSITFLYYMLCVFVNTYGLVRSHKRYGLDVRVITNKVNS